MRPTVLVVEDEPAGRNVVESILFKQGYNLEFASNGKEALQKASALKPDLILLDIMLPEMDGIEVCQHLRKDRDLAEVPVVMITALDDRNTRIACLDAGADDFIVKPFDHAELRARVRSITRLNRYRLLHERSLLFSWIAENASDGYILLQADDSVLYANPRARFYLGLDTDVNTPVSDKFMNIAVKQYTLHPDDAWTGWSSTVPKNESPKLFLVRPESNTSHEFWLETTIFEPTRAEGMPRTRVVRLRDVTADILNRRNTRSFGEAIAHKIRTPVSHMVSSLDLLARMAPRMSQDEIIHFASTAVQGAKRLHETINRILQYSNLHASIDSPEGFNLSDFKQLVEKVSLEMGLNSISVQIVDELNSVQIILPVQAVEVILWELLGNSKKFHPDKTPNITVEVFRAEAQGIKLLIRDDGVSLSPRQLTIAWLPYYQGEKDFTGELPGMGLGLPTVSAIIWGAGGSCRITNREDGSGVIVELIIPEVTNSHISRAL